MTGPQARRTAALLFWPLLAVWTWLLVRPNPIPEVVSAIPLDWRFLAAKALHGGTYAFLAGLGLIWPATSRGRTVVIALLLAHGVGTEIIQTYVPNRSGRVRDVVVDWAGILAGVTLTRRVVRTRRAGDPIVPVEFTGTAFDSGRPG